MLSLYASYIIASSQKQVRWKQVGAPMLAYS